MSLSKLFLAGIFLCSSAAYANLCTKWSEPQKVGLLDSKLLKEVSGLAVSRQFPDRMYHHNDSGDIGKFYVTSLTGNNLREVQFTLDKVRDVEDMSLGPCAHGQCIFLGDIGDNKVSRPFIDVWIIPETEALNDVLTTAKKVKLLYPDDSHNAESMTVHPQTGDVYILTKETDEKNERRSYPAKLYRARQQELANTTVKLEFIGAIDLPWMNYNYGLFGGMATSMDISPDGKNLLVVTYENTVEINLDKVLNETPQSRKWEEEKDYRIKNLRGKFTQLEAGGYSPDGNSIYLESEFKPKYGDKELGIYRMDCLSR